MRVQSVLNEGNAAEFLQAVDPSMIRQFEQQGVLEEMEKSLATEGSSFRESAMAALGGVANSDDVEFFKGGDIAVVYPASSGFVGEQKPEVFIRHDGVWHISN